MVHRSFPLPLLLLAAFLAGCGGDAAPPADAPDEAIPADEAQGVESRTGVRVAGVLMVGENTAEFRPCEGGAPLWLDGPLSADLVALHDELTPGVEPLEGIFLDVVADIGPPPATGPGTAYEGALIVDQVRRAAFEGWNCGDVDADLVVGAAGTEPFWRLEVGSEAAEFATPEGTRILEMQPIEQDPEGWVLQGTDPDAGNVFVSMITLPCRNAMSGAYSHLTVEVQMGERTLRGCGWLGPSADPDAA